MFFRIFYLWLPQRPTHLSQRALQFPQEVGILHTAGVVVDVVDLKAQLLHHLKVVVDDKRLGKLGVEGVHDLLGSADLTDTRGKIRTYFETYYCYRLYFIHKYFEYSTIIHMVWITQRFQSFLLFGCLTSHQCDPVLFMLSTHMGSDLENVSMSSRLLQETLMATLVTQSVALGPWAPKFAIPALVDKHRRNCVRKRYIQIDTNRTKLNKLGCLSSAVLSHAVPVSCDPKVGRRAVLIGLRLHR